MNQFKINFHFELFIPGHEADPVRLLLIHLLLISIVTNHSHYVICFRSHCVSCWFLCDIHVHIRPER